MLPDVNVEKIYAFLNLSLHFFNHYTVRAYGEAEVQFHAFKTSGLHEGGDGIVHSQEGSSYRLDNPWFVSQQVSASGDSVDLMKIPIGGRNGESGQQWQKNFLSSKMSRLGLGPTQPHV